MQQMMTAEIEASAPALYETDGQGDEAIVVAHWFSPLNGWDWYMTEYDPQTKQAFGLVKGFADELGYFSIAEFEEINESKGMEAIERDEYWTPKKLREVR